MTSDRSVSGSPPTGASHMVLVRADDIYAVLTGPRNNYLDELARLMRRREAVERLQAAMLSEGVSQ